MGERYARVRHEGRVWSARVLDSAVELLDGDWLRAPGAVVKTVSTGAIEWLPPVADPTILCVGRNYRAHAEELNNEVPQLPLFFLKQRGALAADGQVVHAPGWAGRIDYEGELVLVIGRTVRDCRSSDEALAAIKGLTIGNDITARALQSQDGQWTRAKGFDEFAPVGPWVVVDENPESRRVTTRVNGEIRQDGSTDEMIFACDRLIMEASRFMTLRPGDLIFTGTPSGVGPVQDGNQMEITIQGIGTLSNSIKIGD
ncbi:fumarylacetoacetate hydrolase family protein [Sulfobacillus harzensis]|uniref:Fumarylacetoacetate hydrolase family protein n=1 Tax=Sulfobacillus harzensis TaxID=2729629 RepID=A0A7Y0L2W3_9FIRM|nr:fumarylacetoacetate hydrolase family protein [Sulfobacillus harzensis]NMP22287.1 fumarylacetoacetate hydrolase family protein [Sulfobacillus harzensis]